MLQKAARILRQPQNRPNNNSNFRRPHANSMGSGYPAKAANGHKNRLSTIAGNSRVAAMQPEEPPIDDDPIDPEDDLTPEETAELMALCAAEPDVKAEEDENYPEEDENPFY